MEPKLPEANNGHERSLSSYGENLEQKPSSDNIEREEKKEIQTPQGEASAAALAALPVLPTLQVQTPIADDADDGAISDDSPSVAKDDDLIEKEWVAKAKKIILQTKNDPYRREQEVSKLQADYLRKRYGKELGSSL